jgi:hypothetical protein
MGPEDDTSVTRTALADEQNVTETARYYSARRLSPFHGTRQVVQIDRARALSGDGEHWELQFLVETPVIQHGHPQAGQMRRRYLACAFWAAGEGVSRMPVHPSLAADMAGFRVRLEALLGALEQAPPLPFAAADRLELWLLDAERRQPLALLRSVCTEEPPPIGYSPDWVATHHGDVSFVSERLAAGGAAPGGARLPHREYVVRRIHKLAGANRRAQWFRREADGSGTGLVGVHVGAELEGRRLPRAAFPELLLREDLADPEDAALAREFNDWQAPYLLTLPGLSARTRDRLEEAARRRPTLLYELRHLLPEVIDPERLKVALVEAVLRQAR